MKVSFVSLLLLFIALTAQGQRKSKEENGSAPKSYIGNRAPLVQNQYIELPLGAIKPGGWLREMLVRQKSGATGNLDKLYPLVMNERNGWLGGDGDQWERGPYWIDGLLPLAYILEDKDLIAKTKPWVEWAINSQQADGYFGPSKDYGYERGVQRDNSKDWWPKMVMLKILKQYYSATQDQRVIKLMTAYFRYQLKELPQNPLDKWTFWARYRGGDNLMIVYWLYNITGDSFLLQLGDLIHKQTFDYTNAFLNTDMLSRNGSIHCVNLAQGIKAPGIYYQHHPESKYLQATDKGFADLKKYNGFANGMYGGDEGLHGNKPTQGSELCSAVELMFSLESLLPITGKVAYADHLEKIAFNALPTQTTDDYLQRQYFQQANQVLLTRETRNFQENHGGTDACFGLLTGYPCCTANMHQGWPKFTQNLWYATPDKGLAALVYAPNEVTAYVAGGTEVKIKEETTYPFGDVISFRLTTGKEVKSVRFPFHLRVPAWCKSAQVKVNGDLLKESKGDTVVVVDREWKSGDVIELNLPMHIFKTTWYENSIAVERGPIVYALKIAEEWKEVKNEKDPIEFGSSYFEVFPKSPWNYGLLQVPSDKFEQAFKVQSVPAMAAYPWNPENAPVTVITRAKRIPSWGLYNGMTGPIPFSIINGLETAKEAEEITLIPYGCSNLRISQFPVVRP
ncbi:MAG TPA: beta-L-arabinofuranosidase domain-containing protein [Chitinophagaceae bacterium]|nr:beta-L-arabinofuranosidase domain-containing protein [Chitinophagaceae bacterium]